MALSPVIQIGENISVETCWSPVYTDKEVAKEVLVRGVDWLIEGFTLPGCDMIYVNR